MLNRLNQYINDYCIYRCDPNKKYSPQLPNGQMPRKNMVIKEGLNFQFYLPRLVSHPVMFAEAIEMLTLALMGYRGRVDDDFQLMGPETASAPYLAGIQQYYYKEWGKEITISTYRRNRKGSGLYNYINGKPNDKPVIVFDDLFMSGYSMHRVMEFCHNHLELPLYERSLSLIALHKFQDAQEFRFRPKENIEIRPLFVYCKEDFDLKYNPEKYWSPIDALY